ncbi:MAG: hypothetical protein ACJ8F7_10430 [Gemmataceae bacterium]
MDDREQGGGMGTMLLVGVVLLLLAGGGGVGYVWLLSQRSQQAALRELEAARAAAEVRAHVAAPLEGPQDPGVVPQKLPPEAPPTDNPLDDLNKSFRAAYRTARLEAIATTSPIVLVDGDNLVLFRDRKRQSVAAVPKAYHLLKDLAHVPLAVYLLTRSADGTLDQGRLDALSNYIVKVEAVNRKRQEQKQASGERADEVFAESLRFARKVLTAKAADPEARKAFAKKMGPAMLALAADAAKLQIDGYHEALQEWKADLSADEWKKLKIVVMGSAMPRVGNLAVQYFAWLLREPGEGKRIIYAESLFEEDKALALLGTHQIDSDIGAAFFDDDQRMHRDLLADAAKEILKKKLN